MTWWLTLLQGEMCQYLVAVAIGLLNTVVQIGLLSGVGLFGQTSGNGGDGTTATWQIGGLGTSATNATFSGRFELPTRGPIR